MNQCPANDKLCNKCGKYGQFAIVCKTNQNSTPRAKSSTSFHGNGRRSSISIIGSMDYNGNIQFKYVKCKINGREMNLLLDLGAKVSILHKSFVFGIYRPQDFLLRK